MNRLWVRLSLAFALVVILAMTVLGVAVRRTLQSEDFTGENVPAEIREYFQQLRNEEPPVNMTPILIFVGVLSIVAGALMSRNLTAPLNELGEAARAIGAQDLSQRVKVKGTEETKIVAQRFNEMAEHLQKEELLRRNLLADVAHELRHPVHVLQGNLQAILEDVYPLSKEEIGRLAEQTQHLAALVNDLHELAQAEARQLVLNRQPTDLARLVKETADFLQPLAAEKQIALHVELLGVQPVLSLDSARIRQALNNLLDNALTYTPAGGQILVRVAQRGDDGVIEIQDNGPGIEPDLLPHIFDRFYRTDKARRRDGSGAGLGLAIVKVIVELHGGAVTAMSGGTGQGSLFVMRLPIAPPVESFSGVAPARNLC